MQEVLNARHWVDEGGACGLVQGLVQGLDLAWAVQHAGDGQGRLCP